MQRAKSNIIKLFFNKLRLSYQPEVVFLIGLPGSGKSTYVKNQRETLKKFRKYAVCSTDNYIETYASISGKKYHEVFEQLYPDAEKHFFENIRDAVKNNMSMFIDRTNCSTDDRQQILNLIPPNYHKRAVIFHVPQDELKKRLYKRSETTGKFISDEVLQKIVDKYEHPTNSEFDTIELA